MRVSAQTPLRKTTQHVRSSKVTLICDIEHNELDYLFIEYHNSTTTTYYDLFTTMTTAPMSLSAARFSAAQPSFQQHSLAKNTEAFTQAECTRWRTNTQVPITRPTPDKLSFREPNGLPSNKPQPVECSPAGSMRRRILDGLVTSPVTIEPILEGSPL